MGDIHTSLLWFDRLRGERPLPSYLSVPLTTSNHLATHPIKPSVIPYTAFIHHHASRNDAQGTIDWYTRMLRDDVRPNVHTFAALLMGCVVRKDVDGAEEWVRKMREEFPELELDGACYNTLINVSLVYVSAFTWFIWWVVIGLCFCGRFSRRGADL
jgi:pentatricopeptide repeat protein